MTLRCKPRVRREGLSRMLLVIACAAATIVVAPGAAQLGSSMEPVLARMGFAPRDVRRLERGDAIIRSLETRAGEELAHAGVVYLDASPDEYVQRLRGIEEFERGPSVLQIGSFSTPPRVEDLRSLSLSADDFAELPACRPGRCEMKLSSEAMARFHREVDWSSSHAWRQADAVLRRMLLDLVVAYQAEGNAALGAYVDHGRPLPAADQFRALLASREALPDPVPILFYYLDHYPTDRPEGAEDFFYWSIVDFGLKPTIRVNHVTIYPFVARRSTRVAYVIAIKQLYASHYFRATLELRFLIDRAGPSGQRGAALASVARSRTDGITGFRGAFLRPVVRRRSRDGLRRYLEHVRLQLQGSVPGPS